MFLTGVGTGSSGRVSGFAMEMCMDSIDVDWVNRGNSSINLFGQIARWYRSRETAKHFRLRILWQLLFIFGFGSVSSVWWDRQQLPVGFVGVGSICVGSKYGFELLILVRYGECLGRI